MRKIQVVVMSVLLSGIGLSGFAQNRTNRTNTETESEMRERQQNLNREMTLEREYDPIVQDATKVSTLPAVREMNITKRPIAYSDYAVPMLPDKELNILPPGALMTDVFHTKRNGYLHFGGGMLMNLMGDFGYHLLNTERDRLGVSFSHRSTNSTVVDDEWLPSYIKRKAKLNDNIGGLDYKHHFDNATLSLGGKFGYSAFNYYGFRGMPYYLTASSAMYNPRVLPDDSITQGNRLINVYGGISSDTPTSLGFHFLADYTNFNQKYSLSKDFNGMTENHIALDFGLRSPVNYGQSFGVNVKANLLSYTAPSPIEGVPIDSFAFNTHYNAALNPYFHKESDTWKLLLGANLMLVSQNDEIKVYASPNIALDVQIGGWSVFYADLGGGIESNSMAELSRTNRYINPAFTPDASKTWADLKLGIRGSVAEGFWFDVFGGYKYTESDVFFNPSSYPWLEEGFNCVSMVFQPTSQRFQAGATVKYDYKHVFDFYLKGVYDHYMLKYSDTWKNKYAGLSFYTADLSTIIIPDSELKAYGKPTFTGNAGINVRPIEPLTLNLDYGMMSGIYAYYPFSYPGAGNDDNNLKMKAIHDLRFRTSWKFNDMFGIYAQFNNLLFRKQALYYGYPLQPFSAMVGFNINF